MQAKIANVSLMSEHGRNRCSDKESIVKFQVIFYSAIARFHGRHVAETTADLAAGGSNVKGR